RHAPTSTFFPSPTLFRSGDARVLESLPPGLGDPVTRPGRTQGHADLGIFEPGVQQFALQVIAHRRHRRTPRVGGGDGGDDAAVLDRDIAEHAEVDEREHRHLGISHATGGGTGTIDRLGAGGILGPEHHGHHRPSGWARATTCISASSFDRASVWSPSRPFCPFTPTPARPPFSGRSMPAAAKTWSRMTPASSATSAGSTPIPASATAVSTGWVSNSSDHSGHSPSIALSRRVRDSSVPRARVSTQRPAKSRW